MQGGRRSLVRVQGGLTSRSDVFHVLVHSPKVTAKDGPSARLRQVDSMPEFPGVVTDMFRRLQHDLGLWFHDVREVWRQAQYGHALLEIVLLSRGFSKVFFNQTLAYLRRLDHVSISYPGETVRVAHEDARMRAAVLRLLLSGELVTQDVVCRHHYKTKQHCDCSMFCGSRSSICWLAFVVLYPVLSTRPS